MRLDVRTKPTVEAGIVKEIAVSANVMLYDYQPGNGTRYVIMIMSVENMGMRRALAFGNHHGWVVTHINGSEKTSMLLPEYVQVTPDLIDTELGVRNKSDAYVIAEFIADVCGLKFGDQQWPDLDTVMQEEE